MKPSKYVDAVLEMVKTKYHDQIDIVTVYGSYARDEMHPHSDIDMFFIPRTNEGFSATFEVIIDDVGYDFFPISWNRLEGIAHYKEPLVSLLLEGTVLFHHDEEAFAKYKHLQQVAKDYQEFEGSIRLLQEEIKALYFDYPSSLPEILSKCILMVAYKNKTYLKKGTLYFEEELASMQKPHLFVENIKFLISEPSLKQTKKFIQDTFDFVEEKNTSQIHAEGFYEELKSIYQKGHETTDLYKQFFIRGIIERETKSLFQDRYQFPKTPRFEDFLDQHEREMRKVLQSLDCHILEYDNVDEFIALYLKQ